MKRFLLQFKKNGIRGFTLIEMMVSIAIFAIVAVVAVGALLKIVDANKKAQALEISINNLNFALESMTREMRVGSNYYCSTNKILSTPGTTDGPPSCPIGGTWGIRFLSSKTLPTGTGSTCRAYYAYYYDGSSLSKVEQDSCLSNSLSATSYTPLISSDPNLDARITFTLGTVKIVPPSSGNQSYAQFHFKGFVGAKEKNRTNFDIQTTVSQRLADY